ncbi:restriction endonuclease subunit S [Proteus hauseri]|uniref:restriction endonuclease subunit S n=1 Tax=Proteus hauseri TaxID=183417 RepID=UPI0032D9EA6B
MSNSEWGCYKLSEVIKVKSGSSLSNAKMECGDIPVYGGNGISGYHSTYNTEQSKLIIGRVGEYCGAIYQSRAYSWITDNALFVSEKKISISDEYLYFLLCFLDLNKYANRNAQPLISGKTLDQVMCYVPTCKKEQQKIAEILSTVDRKIDLIDKKIAATKTLKIGLMQKLFSEGVGVQDDEGHWQPHTKFKDSLLGKIPDSWKTVKLEEISVINPKPYKPESMDTLVSFVGMADTSEDAKLISPSVKKYEEVKKGFTSFLENDVLVAKITPCFENGKGALARELKNGIGFGSTEFHVIRANYGLSCPDFIYYLTTSGAFRSQGEFNMTGTAGQKRVSKNFIEKYLIACPPLIEQQMISNILNSIDKKLSLLEQQKAETKNLKKGLMQKLLTGEWRVSLNEIENT